MLKLYARKKCLYFESIVFALEEKRLPFEIIKIHRENEKIVSKISSEEILPILRERHEIIYHYDVILCYVEERYPHPSLLPSNHLSKIQVLDFVNSFEKKYHFFLKQILKDSQGKVKNRILKDNINNLAHCFEGNDFFASNEISIADCLLTCLLHKLFGVGILNYVKNINDYWNRVSQRKAFRKMINKCG